MRKLFIIVAALFSILGIIFTILPLGTIALLPVGLALVFAFLAFKKSDNNQKKFPTLILIIAVLSLVVVIGKEVLMKDEVIADQQFDEKKIESKKEAQKDLEELEGLE
jgi:di/tricarboxylate transporter